MKRNTLLSLLAFSISLGISFDSVAVVQAGADIAVVQTQSGKVQGFVRDGIFSYRGIPYATAERFMPPKAVEKWQDTKLAVRYGNICPQGNVNPMNTFLFTGPALQQSDDCQNLNVWTPSISDGKKRPVMVWIHGGGFVAGSSMESDSYHGENLSRTGDVVVVSVNHRLNVMGFLDLSAYGEQYKHSVNLGIQDLVASLEWVKANIAQFGGDPDNVTIFGESGGGAKVLTLMATPSAKGLFHKAIVQSGALERSGMNFLEPKVSQRAAEITLEKLNIKPTEIAKLKEAPYDEIVKASNEALKQTAQELQTRNPYGQIGLVWIPTRDGDFIPEFPVEPVKNKFVDSAKDIPLLIGSNFSEWVSFPLQVDFEKTLKDNKNLWSAEETQKRLTEKYGEKTPEIIEAFKQAYPNRPIADALYVDSFLRAPALKTAGLKADQKGAPVYNYLFTWDTPVMDGLPMAYHTSEIPFVFNGIKNAEFATGGGEEAQALADKMSRAWTNFAKTGNPNAEGLPQWDAYTRENGNVMIFDNQPEVKQHHDEKLQHLLAPAMKF